MKKISLFIISFSICCTYAQKDSPGRVVKCLSGDCVNGTGEAQMTDVDNFSGDIYYRGQFKDGLVDGEGIQVKSGDYFIGHFKKGSKVGYVARYGAKMVDGKWVPDSTGNVSFAEYSSEFAYKRLVVHPDGSVESEAKYDGHFKDSWDYHPKIKDKWINDQVTAFKAARAGNFAAPVAPAGPTSEVRMLAKNKSNTARDQWIQAIQWSCLPDRKYYITATPQTKYHQLPFAGSLVMQVVAPDNTVAYEGELGNYWTPRTPGNYTFLIKFVQAKIVGSGAADQYVNGVRIEWEFMSKKDL